MDPSDVISLVQCAIVLLGNAHFVYNIERRKSVLAKALPEAVDLLSNKKCVRLLSKCKTESFGSRFLKHIAKGPEKFA